VTKSLGKNMFINLKHPPYSPDLAPMDFAVFPYIKSFAIFIYSRVYSISEQNFVNKNELQV
jgi:hypothetical protein